MAFPIDDSKLVVLPIVEVACGFSHCCQIVAIVASLIMAFAIVVR